ncbi:FVYE domain-containing protein [Cavenderia fasciculata]|uniref:FVYE domain-containing protein n=1 Tax=Cavenderia fasciculata TaxID=261658 RepID=F4PPW8_CACFS|nr:FVYE domain-containing protein [Cavenderia fasciculata]EGG22431.1 FVYE domain-containing protein [Cavenderia fasciculata]|eukprot:XP_004360282.1 FVYE domain-containing protein [Cavenderia fasciculata]
MEPTIWMPDQSAIECTGCQSPFSIIRRRHHCRKCGLIFCDPCSNHYTVLPAELGYSGAQRLCRVCHSSFEQKHQFYESDGFIGRLQLRSSATYEYSKALPDIGNIKNGFRKSYFLAKKDGDEILVSILTPSTHCPWSMSSDKLKQKFIKTLSSIKHSYIYPILNVETCGSNDKLFVYRTLSSKGSLKDLIFKSKPMSFYDSKYITKKSNSSGVPLKSVNKYGRQILEAMIFLKQKGINFTNLHTGNVLLSSLSDTCMLSDIENSLVGFKPFYHDYLVGMSANKKENQESICFGHVLFEMIVGCPLMDQPVTNFAPVIPKEAMDMLNAIFTDASKPTPSLEDIIKHSFFVTGLQIEVAQEGKLKKSHLQFIKDYANLLEPVGSIQSPRSTSSTSSTPQFKKQNSSTSMLESNSANGTMSKSISSTQIAQPSVATQQQPSPVSVTNPLMASVQEKMKSMKLDRDSKQATLTTTQSSPSPPPPPPPPSLKQLPKQEGRNALLDSIRNPNNVKTLKKTNGPKSKPDPIKKKSIK